jgi:SHS2 domain-containing protein
MQPPFEFFDHTADVGLIARGATLGEAFANAAKGMFALMVDLERVAEREERHVEVEADDAEGLLVNWLAELLYISEVDGLVFRRFDIEEAGETRLAARAFGEPLDLARHNPQLMIKAVTRHQLAVARDDAGCRVRVILDI